MKFYVIVGHNPGTNSPKVNVAKGRFLANNFRTTAIKTIVLQSRDKKLIYSLFNSVSNSKYDYSRKTDSFKEVKGQRGQVIKWPAWAEDFALSKCF